MYFLVLLFLNAFYIEKRKQIFQSASLCYVDISVQNLHGFSAAAGDHITGLYMEQLVSDGAVDIAFLFSPNHTVQTALEFIFHRLFLSKGYFT